MLTAQHYERLPGTARAIVDTDRSIAAIVSRPVVPFRTVQKGGELAELLRDRRVYRTRAHQTWGRPLRGDGASQA